MTLSEFMVTHRDQEGRNLKSSALTIMLQLTPIYDETNECNKTNYIYLQNSLIHTAS